MDMQTINNYRSNIKLIQRVAFLMLIIQGVVSLYHLFVPSIMVNSTISMIESVIFGIVGFLIVLLISARMVDLESGDKLTKIVRIVTIAGIIHQTSLGLPTIYSISFYVIAVIGENILLPKLEIIQRTQNYASHDKLTEEVYSGIVHADHYLENQVKWSINTIIMLIITAIISIFMVTIFNILPILFPEVLFVQIFSLISLLALIVIVIMRAFPEFEQLPDEYEIYQS